MKPILLILLLSLTHRVQAGTHSWKPEPAFLEAICQLESNGGRFLVGDSGKSLGHYQMQKGAWLDVVKWRKGQNLPTHDYRNNVLDPKISRIYAANYLTILYHRLWQAYQREPAPPEIYAAYNMGLRRFRQCNYRLERVNRITEEKCKQLVALLE